MAAPTRSVFVTESSPSQALMAELTELDECRAEFLEGQAKVLRR
jgi:hypothetical protein